jgi:hypothetical protein
MIPRRSLIGARIPHIIPPPGAIFYAPLTPPTNEADTIPVLATPSNIGLPVSYSAAGASMTTDIALQCELRWDAAKFDLGLAAYAGKTITFSVNVTGGTTTGSGTGIEERIVRFVAGGINYECGYSYQMIADVIHLFAHTNSNGVVAVTDLGAFPGANALLQMVINAAGNQVSYLVNNALMDTRAFNKSTGAGSNFILETPNLPSVNGFLEITFKKALIQAL